MESYDLIRLLSRPSSAPEVEAALQRLQIRRRPECRRADPEDPASLQTQDWLINRRKGIEFGFEDRSTFLGKHPDEAGQGPMMLTQLYLYGDHPEVKPFPGRLPFGLTLADGPEEVRSKLARYEDRRRSYTRDTWELPDYRMTASYKDGHIGFLLFALRPPAVAADAEDARVLPMADKIVAVLGRALNDHELALILSPLRLEQSLRQQGDRLLASFRERFGLQIYFSHVAGGRQYALSNAIFYPDHAPGAAGWPGDLPHGLTFADGPETFMRKLGRAPDDLNETDFTAIATWRFPDHATVVMFSTIENVILSVQLVAAGAPIKSQR